MSPIEAGQAAEGAYFSRFGYDVDIQAIYTLRKDPLRGVIFCIHGPYDLSTIPLSPERNIFLLEPAELAVHQKHLSEKPPSS